MEQTIFRVAKNPNNPYVMIDKRISEDSRLSWKAKGIMLYLLSRPNDWAINLVDVEKQSTDGRDSVQSGVNELIALGYLERLQNRKGGKFGGVEYIVHEEPIATATGKAVSGSNDKAFTATGKTVNGKTVNGKSQTTNNDYTNKDNTNTEKDNIKAEKPKTAAAAKKPKPANAKLEKPTGVTEQTWADLLQVRKAKGKPLTVTAWNYNYSELQKGLDAGVSLENMLVTWAAKGWQGFKFEWYLNEQKGGNYGNANNQPANQNFTPANAATAQQWEDANWAAFEQYYSGSSQ